MRHKYSFFSLLLAVGICGALLNAPAQAQPDDNNAPKGENPPNWNWNPGGRAGGGRGNRGILGGRPLRLPLTPEQIRLLREQRQEARAATIKQRLTGAGFTDEALQTAIVNEYKAQDTAMADLVEKWQKISQALLVNQTPEADMTAMLKDFRDATAKEKMRRDAASAALEAQFQISKKPILDALLLTMGLTGDQTGLVAQVIANGVGQLLTLPNAAGMADGGPIGNGALRVLPVPEGGAGGIQLFRGGLNDPAIDNGNVFGAPPQPARPGRDRGNIFF
ncbi:hypothetical protein IAD21_03895 [Abditibacteriota bacterium]|nr:hypothetical protein IAD21_03895 [Abditibacteriota bacterium]